MNWIAQPRFVCGRRCGDGEMLICDNAGVICSAEPYPPDCDREMQCNTLLGDEVFA